MALIQETDYGTPKRISETLVTLEIDGKPVTVPAGTSVMRAAAQAGVQIPKLCASDNLEPFGSCRLCLIEDRGAARHACLLHDSRRGRHEGAHAIAQTCQAAPGRDGALRFGFSAGIA